MAIAVDDIITKVSILLNDTAYTRWSAAELIYWLNAGEVQIIREDPPANTTHGAVLLVAGTKQTIPAGSIVLIDIYRNMGTTGTTPGPAITMTFKGDIDRFNPSWHEDDSSVVVKNFMYDMNNPKTYWVYPKSPGTNYVDMVRSTVPTAAVSGGNINLDDDYESALIDYILFRAYQKDAEHGMQDKRVLGHWQSFLAHFGKEVPA